jgi:hypothetical protein
MANMVIEMSQLLLVFGFSWMIVGCFVGLFQGLKHDLHLADLDKLARNGDLLGYHQSLSAFKKMTTIHTHSMLFPLIVIVTALAIPLIGYSEIYTTVLGVGLVAATMIWTVGGFLNQKLLKGLGDLLLLCGIAMAAFGLL